jgi:hypothetical protein
VAGAEDKVLDILTVHVTKIMILELETQSAGPGQPYAINESVHTAKRPKRVYASAQKQHVECGRGLLSSFPLNDSVVYCMLTPVFHSLHQRKRDRSDIIPTLGYQPSTFLPGQEPKKSPKD